MIFLENLVYIIIGAYLLFLVVIVILFCIGMVSGGKR